MHAGLHTLLSPLIAPERLVWAEQVGPMPVPPPKPYAEIDVSEGGFAPYVMPIGPDDQGNIRWIEHGVKTVQVTFYGRDAMDRAVMFGLKLRTPLATTPAASLNIGIQTVEPATDIPFRNDAGQYEDRSMVEFTAQMAHELIVNHGLIEHVDLEQTEPGGGTVDGRSCGHQISAPGTSWPVP